LVWCRELLPSSRSSQQEGSLNTAATRKQSAKNFFGRIEGVRYSNTPAIQPTSTTINNWSGLRPAVRSSLISPEPDKARRPSIASMIHTFRPCVVPTPSTQLKPSPLKPVDHEFALDERGEHVAPHRRFIQLLKNAHPQEVLRQGVFRTKFRSQGHQSAR